MTRRYNYEEHQIQKAIVAFCRLNPDTKWIFSSLNGGERSTRQGAWLNEEGLLKGVSDLFLPVARGGYHGLFIEVKTVQGRVTKEQKSFMEAMRAAGYKTIVVRSTLLGIDAVMGYLRGNL